ncbi:ABC transporter substrate-binding protein [Paenibacillus gorillae]|uniref:ABC transporter substrate-binding protein n=1 Tax=Paenibacillus gorillae TaxID=1243662 RepID=UPI0004B2CA71|nr:extracellular solute-binding protein [Paenibacillus gorillae]
MNGLLRLLPFSIVLILLFTGCTQTPEPEQAAIKVMYDNEFSFKSEYGNVFAAKYPKIEVEVAEIMIGIYDPDGIEIVKKKLEQEKPDVLYLNPEQYKALLREGKLAVLDGFIKTSKYPLDSFHPSVLDTLKQMGDGELFGLAPVFSASALFYNKRLFDRYRIEYPTDQMTWDQVLQLAQRFPDKDESGEPVYGLSLQFWESTPSGLLGRINGVEGLEEYNYKQKKVLINQDKQKRNAEKVIGLFQAGHISYYEIQNSTIDYADIEQSPFITGKSAMYLGDYSYFNQINQLASAKNAIALDWDLVTEPINPQYPDQALSSSLIKIFAINAESPNQQAAWEFIQFANSEYLSKLKSKSDFLLSSRTGQVKEKNGHSLEPFYKLNFKQEFTKPDKNHQLFLREYGALKTKQFKEVLEQKKTLDEALNTIQEEGQRLMDTSSLLQQNDSE